MCSLRNALENGLKFHTLVFLGLHGSRLNVHAQIGKLRPSKDAIGISTHLLEVNTTLTAKERMDVLIHNTTEF
jgi:hypothetical protein